MSPVKSRGWEVTGEGPAQVDLKVMRKPSFPLSHSSGLMMESSQHTLLLSFL